MPNEIRICFVWFVTNVLGLGHLALLNTFTMSFNFKGPFPVQRNQIPGLENYISPEKTFRLKNNMYNIHTYKTVVTER